VKAVATGEVVRVVAMAAGATVVGWEAAVRAVVKAAEATAGIRP
jgi:hypothetical protein